MAAGSGFVPFRLTGQVEQMINNLGGLTKKRVEIQNESTQYGCRGCSHSSMRTLSRHGERRSKVSVLPLPGIVQAADWKKHKKLCPVHLAKKQDKKRETMKEVLMDGLQEKVGRVRATANGDEELLAALLTREVFMEAARSRMEVEELVRRGL